MARAYGRAMRRAMTHEACVCVCVYGAFTKWEELALLVTELWLRLMNGFYNGFYWMHEQAGIKDRR